MAYWMKSENIIEGDPEEALDLYFEDATGNRVPIFGEGGGAQTATQLGTTLLGQIPLFPEIRAAGDAGKPIVVAQPQHRAALAYQTLAQAVLAKLG